MRRSRTLSLHRDELGTLDAPGLGAVVAGRPLPVTDGTCGLSDTCYSCLAYISCDLLACMVNKDTAVECVVVTN